ncbi:MAG TPA: efflux RND transporter periplasmic adaptor subunit [Thermoanaerobaculia bacterium]
MVIGGVVIALVIIGSVASSGPKGTTVYVETVGHRDIESIVSAPGEVDPKVKVNISAHVIGKIERLHFKEGDAVRKGQRLVDLERVSYVAQRERMRSELANRRIEVNRARIALKNSDLQFKRAQRLREQGVQAEELFDQTALQYENAKANLAGAEESIHQAQALLAQAEEDLSRTTIVAPMDGKVVELNAHEGEVVITGTMNNPGSVIAVLADLSEVLVVAEVGETEIVRIRTGQPARVHVDAVPDKVYNGNVVEIGSSANTSRSAATGSGIRYFRVKIGLTDADERLRPGMTAQVDIVTEALKSVIAVPVQSVVERDPASLQKAKSKKKENAGDRDESALEKKYVFAVEKEKTKMIEVRTGISDATHVAITAGLTGGESIVTGPFRTIKKLKNEETVVPKKESKEKETASDEDDEKDEQ